MVDDASTDGTGGWVLGQLKAQDSRFSYMRLGSRARGVSYARNTGWRHTKGEWVAFLDSDDEWAVEKLEKQLNLLEQSGHKICHANELWLRNGLKLAQKKKHTKYGGEIFLKCLPLCCMSPSAVMLHRTLFPQGEVFREDFPVCEDYELWLRLAAKYQVALVPDELVIKHGGHCDQLSMRYKAMDYWRVKALAEHLHNEELNDHRRMEVAKMMCQKAKILLKGYKKHNNLHTVPQVESWLRAAKKELEALKSQAIPVPPKVIAQNATLTKAHRHITHVLPT